MKHLIHRAISGQTRHARGVWIMMAATLAAGCRTAPPAPPPPPPAPAAPAETAAQHTSYLFGLTFGEQLHSVGVADQIDADAIERGVKDGLQGKKATRADQQQIQEFVHSSMVAAATANKAAAQAFLAKNGSDESVKTTASGLQYKVVEPGDAKAPDVVATDEVSVNYRGKLLDGTEFDSSYTRGTPATFRINGVIKGWQEALLLMKPGAKWQLFIPPELAYGDSPRPGIPAGSLLIFDVELLSVNKAPAAQAMPNKQPMGRGAGPPPHRPVPPPAPTPTPTQP